MSDQFLIRQIVDDDIARIIETNLTAPLQLTRLAVRRFAERFALGFEPLARRISIGLFVLVFLRAGWKAELAAAEAR